MKLPKVLIFTAVYEGKEYCLADFMNEAAKINYPNKRHIFIDNSKTDTFYKKLKEWGLDIHRIERGANSREAIARSQNYARKIAIDEGYDYLFSLESDIMCPKDIVQDLMRHGKDVTTGFYYIGNREKGVRVPCITLSKFNKTIGAYGTRLLAREEFEAYTNQGLKQVQAGGMGCCLVHKRAFKRVAFTYDPRFTGHSDIYFFNDMFKRKIPVFVDTNIYCEHENSLWEKVKDR